MTKERQNLGEKFTVKGVILLILIITFLIGVPLAIVNIGEPKTPATSEQVHTTIEKYGLHSSNFTEEYVEEYPNLGLISVVGYRTDEFRIEWFETESSKRARSLMSTFNEIMLDARNVKAGDWEYYDSAHNYFMHTYHVGDKHFWAMQIENTAIYGFCYDENYETMRNIMIELGYISE